MSINSVYICHHGTIDLCVITARFGVCAVRSIGILGLTGAALFKQPYLNLYLWQIAYF